MAISEQVGKERTRQGYKKAYIEKLKDTLYGNESIKPTWTGFDDVIYKLNSNQYIEIEEEKEGRGCRVISRKEDKLSIFLRSVEELSIFDTDRVLASIK